MAFLEAFPYYSASVTAIRDESPRVKTFTLQTLMPWKFLAGHHCVIRLTDERHYMAARDYSISSAPSSGVIEVSVARELDGEVSNWLHDRIKVGDSVEISQVLGAHFTWEPTQTEPLLLLAGGIGIAPLISIFREHRIVDARSTITLIYSARDENDICFLNDLSVQRPHESVQVHLSRQLASTQGKVSGRIQDDHVLPYLKDKPTIYICGPSSFVNSMEHRLYTRLGVDPARIRTERFG